VYSVQVDHLNTPRSITNQSGNEVWRWDSTEPFGDSVPNGDPNNIGNVFDMPLGFAGQYRDRETGTYYNYFRDYDPSLGRYTRSDPIGLAGGLNRYAYVNGNPILFKDPSGLVIECHDVFDGFTTRTERFKAQDEVSGWVRRCGPVLKRAVPGIPDPLENSRRESTPGGFPGDVEWEGVCRYDWEVTKEAVWETRTITVMRHHIRCENNAKCSPQAFNVGPLPEIPLDLAIP
jgi:RHS repeat-associated protein